MQWSNVNAIVTGGASGLGYAVVERIVNSHGCVTILDQNIAPLNTDIAQHPKNLLAIQTDVTHDAEVNQAIQQATTQFGPLNLVVNCAGIATSQKLISSYKPLSSEQFSQVMNINVTGTLRVCLQVAQLMQNNPIDPQTQERGVIINTASIAAFDGQIGQIAYSASKGAIVSMTLPMARELAKFGIRVMTIAPGLFDTPLMSGLPETVRHDMAEQIPFPKKLGQPADFASLVQHIVENPQLNGEVIRLDGGLRMPPR